MRNTLYFVIVSLLLLPLTCCTPNTRTNSDLNTSRTITELEEVDSVQLTKKHDYQLADELVDNLLAKDVDTVLFYKRTCINCCDYYNVFWTTGGKQFLHKFYFDFDDMQNHSLRIELKNKKIFAELNKHYSNLRNTSIKENQHKVNDSISKSFFSSHYCYSIIEIYTRSDSIISNQMKDIDFNQYSGIQDENGTFFLNDNYTENYNSKWHKLLTIIENEIASMDKTSNREQEIMRVLK